MKLSVQLGPQRLFQSKVLLKVLQMMQLLLIFLESKIYLVHMNASLLTKCIVMTIYPLLHLFKAIVTHYQMMRMPLITWFTVQEVQWKE